MNKNQILDIIKQKVPKEQEWIWKNIQYMTLVGSHAYSLNHIDSDWDVYAFTVPKKEYIFPENLIWGYDDFPKFEQLQGSLKKGPKKEHLDFQIYNITKYFRLVFDNNPNMIDSLFTPRNCVLIETDIAKLVRKNRKLFLHKGAFHRFSGYAFSQLNKIKTNPEDRKNPERKVLIEKYGYDLKYALHLFRLLEECEQILSEGNLMLGRNKEELKLILKGIYTLKEVEQKFKEKEAYLKICYQESKLPWGKEDHKEEIRNLLTTCLKMFYNSH
jgi:predicted nucleotidyltransferase